MKFLPGIELNKAFYFEVIRPLIKANFPQLQYSAALIGYGSDVLEVDNPTSMDHNWGPRCCIFLSKEDYHLKKEIENYFKYNLPFEFKGFPTNYTDPRYDYTQKLSSISSYPINHLIEIMEFDEYFKSLLELDQINDISIENWLNFKDQILIEITSGEVFYDGLHRLNNFRKKMEFYPNEILKIKLASLWYSIQNEEPFIGRCIEIDDYIGLKLIASRIVSSLIKISFYLDKKYIPYSKWFGTLFKNITTYDKLSPLVRNLLTENNTNMIQDKLCLLYEELIALHNSTEGLPFLENNIRDFHNRPYKVIFAESIVDKLLESIENKKLKEINLNNVSLDIKLESIDFTE